MEGAIKTWKKEKNFVGVSKYTDKNSRIRPNPVSQRYGSKDPDPHQDLYQNVTDPNHFYVDLQEISTGIMTGIKF